MEASKKCCVLEDSSFLISVFDKGDSAQTKKIHNRSWKILSALKKIHQYIEIIIPYFVIQEVSVVLHRKKSSYKVRKKISALLNRKEIWNLSLTPSDLLKICWEYRKIIRDDHIKGDQGNIIYIKSPDFLICASGINFEAQILTYDKNMYDRIYKYYGYDFVYNCNRLDEVMRFIHDLKSKLESKTHQKFRLK